VLGPPFGQSFAGTLECIRVERLWLWALVLKNLSGEKSSAKEKAQARELAPDLISISSIANPEGQTRQIFKFISAAESTRWREMDG
jgi:hypothetical protein